MLQAVLLPDNAQLDQMKSGIISMGHTFDPFDAMQRVSSYSVHASTVF